MKKILSILILALAAVTASAQDDFDPILPGEPNAQYKVTVGISYPEAGEVYGAGSFTIGSEVNISKSDAWFSPSSSVYYKFKHWTLNGVEYSTQSSFTYTVGAMNANFVAVYERLSPDEVTSKVNIVMSPADAANYHTESGQRYLEDDYAYVYCEENTNFIFKGWYEGSKLVSTDRYFYYLVGGNDVTLTAKFEYNPTIPGEPVNNGQTDIDNGIVGDINNDGTVDVQDVVGCINIVLSNDNNKVADMNKDGQIDVQDVVNLINKILNK